MSDPTKSDRLLRALERNPARWLPEVFGRLPGAAVHDDADCCWMVTDVAFPLCNSVMFPRFERGRAAGRIDEILAAGAARGVRQLWWTGPSTAPEIGELLDVRGLAPVERDMPGMALELAGWAAPQRPAGLELVRVRDAATAEDFGRLVASAFGMPEEISLLLARTALEAQGDDADDRLVDLLVVEAGRPAACASLVVDDGVAGIYNVAVRPEAQRRGLGTAVTVAALEAGVERGATDSILHASAAGHGAYLKLGYARIGTIGTWVTRAPAAPS
jgi:GNAT superfamily N-acetyltransferase